MTRLHALDEVLPAGVVRRGVDEIDACLIDRDRVERGENADVLHARILRHGAAVAVDRHVAHDVDKDNLLAEALHDAARRVRHCLQKCHLVSGKPGAGLTAAGPCAKGDVLATVGGDILVVADTVAEALSRTVELMLRSGGELVTVLLGTGVDPESTTALRRRLEDVAPGVDVTAYAADGMTELAQIGVE